MACHTRSASLPAISHPFVLKAEEELHKLRASLATHSISYEIMLDAVKAVGRVYECMDDLFSISSIRNELSHSEQRKLVDQELEESIKLIDICHTSRDNLDSIRGRIQDLESAFRRGESEATRTAVREYIVMVKKANKDVKKLSAAGKIECAVADSSDVASLLSEIREFTSSLLQSFFVLAKANSRAKEQQVACSQEITSEKSSCVRRVSGQCIRYLFFWYESWKTRE